MNIEPISNGKFKATISEDEIGAIELYGYDSEEDTWLPLFTLYEHCENPSEEEWLDAVFPGGVICVAELADLQKFIKELPLIREDRKDEFVWSEPKSASCYVGKNEYVIKEGTDDYTTFFTFSEDPDSDIKLMITHYHPADGDDVAPRCVKLNKMAFDDFRIFLTNLYNNEQGTHKMVQSSPDIQLRCKLEEDTPEGSRGFIVSIVSNGLPIDVYMTKQQVFELKEKILEYANN